MLVINGDEVKALLPMNEAIATVERSFREVAQGSAKNLPRLRAGTPVEDLPGFNYFFHCIPALLASSDVMAVRLVSAVRIDESAGVRFRNDQYCGWVLLFSTRTGEPLALIDDLSLSGIRVGATVGMAMKYLAGKKARRVALFGSGRQARTNLEAVSCVRSLEEIRVFSPNANHRELFAAEMTPIIGARVVAVDSPEKAMEQADIVLCTANSATPLFDGGWLRPGVTVSSIAGNEDASKASWGRSSRTLDDLTFERAHRLVVGSKQQAVGDQQFLMLIPGGEDGAKVVELGDVLLGKAPGRTSDSEIIVFRNTGTGSQFAATGAVVYEKARAGGLGWEIPNDRLVRPI